MRRLRNNKYNRIKQSVWLDIVIMIILYASSVMGSSYFGVSIGGITLSPYRFIFLMTAVFTFVKYQPLRIPCAASEFLKFYLIWVVWGGISLLWAKDRGKSLLSVIILGMALGIMIICCQILTDRKRIQMILNVISICFIFVTFMGVYEALTGHYYFVNNPSILARMAIYKYRAPLVFFTNQNDYSLFLVYGICVSIYNRGVTKSKIIRLIVDITIAIAIWLIIFADSRGCALALVVSGLFWGVATIKLEKRRKHVGMMIVFMCIAIIVVALNASKISEALASFFHFGLVTSSVRSDAYRFQLIKNGIDMIFNSYGLGVGLSNSGYYLEYVYRNTGVIWALHNWFVQVFAESGIIIGILYIYQYFSMYKKIKKIYSITENPIDKKQAQLFLTVIVSFSVGIISPSSVLGMEWLWMTWALIIAFIGQAYKNIEEARGMK